MSFAVLFTFLLAAGCNSRPQTPQQAYVLKSNNETQALTDAGREFGTALQPWLTGGDADIPAAERAIAKLKARVNSIRRDFNNRPIPPGNASRDFHRHTIEYLDWQLTAGEECKKLLETIASTTQANESDRASVLATINRLNEHELKLKAKSDELCRILGVSVKR